jgi:AraC-like DNA-binding protein
VCCLDNALAGGVFGREDADIIEKFLSGAAAMVENAGLEERLSRLAAASAQPDISEAVGKRIEAIKKYLEENYESDISREKLARVLGVNTDYLGTRFKAYTGRTIHEFVNEIRVAEAERMLRDTEMRIIDIAYAVGFESLRTFNREFHRVTGEKPSRFRPPHRLRRA